MKCHELQRQVDAAVEHRTPLNLTDWRDHLDSCESCRKVCENYQILERAIQEWAEIEETPDLSGRVLAVLNSDSSATLPASRQSSRTGGDRSVVALIVACLTLLLVLTLRRSNETDLLENTMPVALEAPIEMEQVIEETRAAYDSLLDSAKDSFEPLTDVVSERDSADELTDEANQNNLETIPQELDTLRREFQQSIGFLTALVPTSD